MCIRDSLKAYELLARLDPARAMPEKREVAAKAFREYKRGPKSSQWKFIQRVLQLNRTDGQTP